MRIDLNFVYSFG